MNHKNLQNAEKALKITTLLTIINNCGKVTIDNIRRSLSTFFFVDRGRGLYYKKPNEKNS